jgi:hypothetical protein
VAVQKVLQLVAPDEKETMMNLSANLFRVIFSTALVFFWTGFSLAQPPGPRGFGGRFGMVGVGRVALANMAAVQKELELTDAQRDATGKLQREMEEMRAASRQQGGFGGFEGLSDEQIRAQVARRLEDARKTAAAEREKLAQILSPTQMDRLEGILVQLAGARSLLDDAIAERIGLNEDQQKRVREAADSMFAQMRGLFQSEDDREVRRAKFADLRAQSEKQILKVLTAEQVAKFDEFKGRPFELPEDAAAQASGSGRGRDDARPRRPRRPTD